MKRYYFIFFFLISFVGYAQITTEPAFPTENDSVKIIFDSSKDSRLGYYTGDLYAHTGVILEGGSKWEYVIESWGNNTTQPKLTNKGGGIYELMISPDIHTFYSVPTSKKIVQLAFVFRTSNSSAQTKDIFIDLYEGSFSLKIIEPSGIIVSDKDEDIPFSASASNTAELKLFQNDQEIKTVNGTELTHTFNFSESGDYWLKATATTNDTIISDSVFVHVKSDPVQEELPQDVMDGINIIDDQTVILVLYAPGKESSFVIGDFNGWLPQDDYRMKQDGDRFWITLHNLTAGEEYAFQYFVDSNIRIADPYTDKILDPWDDEDITNDVYPNLKDYPEGKTEFRVSTFQTNQTPFSWETDNYPIPPKEELVIYELLIRDFTAEGTYNAVIEKLDYLEKLGVNAIEFMPFNEFEGNSSWGYNPNFYFAPDKAYGTKNDLKNLIDECHKRGFIIIQDIVLNHAYNSCPLVKLYWDGTNNRPANDNPWFNTTSPNPVFAWGSDFNHESQATKDFVDRVTKFWMEEYKIDGFRFDFTKGFTNTPGDGGGYDAARIAILKRIANKIWNVNSKAYIILEHFAADAEEKELISYNSGMMVWGNANYNFSEAAMGYHDSDKSNFSRASYQYRNFTKPGLVAYMESHDEERMMFKNLNYGNSGSGYDITDFPVAADRCGLAATFFFSLTGPKMIWQFGELGYDYSINTCEDGSISDGCRTSPKEVRWDYYSDTDRKEIFNIYSALLLLRQQFSVFSSGNESLNLSSSFKSIHLTKNDTNVVVLGNFGVSSGLIVPYFQHNGTWYEFFTEGSENITSTNSAITLQPGEYRLYCDKQLPSFTELTTSVKTLKNRIDWEIYPNPASGQIIISSSKPAERITLYSIYGEIIFTKDYTGINKISLPLNNYPKGIYFIEVEQEGRRGLKKVIIQ